MSASGSKRGEICAKLDIAPSTAWRWLKRYESDADAAINIVIGRPPRLSSDQREQIVNQLLLGPGAHGFDTPLWTMARIEEVIRRTTGVSFNTNYVGALMHSLGWSCQKPARRAKERDEEAIAGWVRDEWPAIKKKPQIRAPR